MRVSLGRFRQSKQVASLASYLSASLPPAAVKVFTKCSFLHAAPQCLPLLDGENDREGRESESKGAWEPIQPCEKASLSIGARERGRTTDDGTSEAARMMKADAATSPPSVVPWNRQNARRRNRKRPDRDSAGRLGDNLAQRGEKSARARLTAAMPRQVSKAAKEPLALRERETKRRTMPSNESYFFFFFLLRLLLLSLLFRFRKFCLAPAGEGEREGEGDSREVRRETERASTAASSRQLGNWIMATSNEPRAAPREAERSVDRCIADAREGSREESSNSEQWSHRHLHSR